MLVTQTTKNAFFFEKFYRGHDPPHPQSCLYTPPVETPSPSAPGQTAQHRQQGRPCQMQGRPRGAIGTAAERWRARSVSETEQICTHSNMNDFQHKNVCKTIDINTRTCYYIDNTRTCYTTTKQEDKNHEKDHRLYRTC